MGNALKFRLEGDVKRFEMFLDKRSFNGKADRIIKATVKRAALYLIREVKQNIRKRRFKENSPLTLALNRNSIPLLKTKELFDAMTFVMTSTFSAEVGFFKGESSGGVTGETIKIQKLVELMHTGYTIEVTDKMRRALIVSLRNQRTKKGRLTGRARKALKALEENSFANRTAGKGKQFYKVKRRTFMTQVFMNPRVQRQVQQIWREGTEELWLAQGATDGEHKDD